MRRPADLALDLDDELLDPGGCRLRLLLLDANERRLVLLIRKPEIKAAVDEQRRTDQGDEQKGIFAEQPTPRRRARRGCGTAGSGPRSCPDRSVLGAAHSVVLPA